jgi:hypothetical protein
MNAAPSRTPRRLGLRGRFHSVRNWSPPGTDRHWKVRETDPRKSAKSANLADLAVRRNPFGPKRMRRPMSKSAKSATQHDSGAK